MDLIFRWTGFVALEGIAAAIAVAAWGYVLSKILGHMRETWWITAYATWKRRHRNAAHRALEAAIASEKNWKSENAEPARTAREEKP